MGEGVRRVTIHDVAGKAGVSTAAVSHAFNDPERLRATTVTRILDAARELGYAPNPHARALHSQRVGVLGVLFPQPIATVFANPFFASFLEGIGSVTDERGIGLLTVTPLGGSLERAIAAAPVDGFVIIGLDERHAEVAPLRKRGVPFVVVDGDAETASSVNVDDEGGAVTAIERLSSLSREDIRGRFEARFTVRRMVDEYLDVYRSLRRHHAVRPARKMLALDTLPANGHESRPRASRARAPRS